MPLKTVTEFPRAVREIENVWITMADGCRLAARAWMPADAQGKPVPAIVECIPYRKRDGTAWRDAVMHPYMAGHGYACLRVDLRGSGDSDGFIADEYTAEEHADCVAVIAWAAAQPWCTGAVGMMGISWGAFNSLQVAALRPPALKAIIAIEGTDDRYADDVHYMGGAMLHDNFAWASAMWAYLSLPSDPLIVGAGWRDRWLARLERQDFWLRQWTAHQRRDDYWRHGSVCEDLGRIKCAVWGVGGWEDGYSNSVPRLLAGLKAPVKGLIGPWGHAFAHTGYPGPQIGFLQECVRWWDHWLKGAENGVMAEPLYRVWMNDSFRPEPFCRERPGRWVAEPGWPSANVEPRALHLNSDGLGDSAGAERALAVRSPQDTGTSALEWCSYGGLGADLPGDQRRDDGNSLWFDGPTLAERLEILGAPVVTLEFSVDRPVAKVAIRLCDVFPDGASSRVTYTQFNLTHRDGHASPEKLAPGKRYRTAIALNHAAHAFLPGHKLRVSISTSYWPQMWPAPEPVTLTLYAGACRIDLPVRARRPGDEGLRPFDPPEGAAPLKDIDLRPERTARTVHKDIATGETTVTMIKDSGAQHLVDIDLDVESCAVESYRIRDGDPLSATGETHFRQGLGRGAWKVRTKTRTRMSLTATTIEVAASLDAFEGERRVFACNKRSSVPRDCN